MRINFWLRKLGKNSVFYIGTMFVSVFVPNKLQFLNIVNRLVNNRLVPWKYLRIPSNTCNSPDSSKIRTDCVWSKESHILMVIQKSSHYRQKFKEGKWRRGVCMIWFPNDLLNLAFLRLKRSDGMRFVTNQSGTEKQKLKKYKVKIK